MVLFCRVILQDHVNRHVTLWVEAPQGKSPSCQV